MRTIQLYRNNSNEILFEAQCNSTKECLEMAVESGCDLSHVDMANQNLKDVCLDDAVITYGNFRGCDLRGANMSEGYFAGSDFSNSLLHAACLNESDFSKASFIHSRFGDTDCAGTNFEHAVFAGLTSFYMKFQESCSQKGVKYMHEDGKFYHMSHPPVVVLGMPSPIILLDTHVLHEGEILPQSYLIHNLNKNNLTKRLSSSHKFSSPGYPANDIDHVTLALAFETGRLKKSCH